MTAYAVGDITAQFLKKGPLPAGKRYSTRRARTGEPIRHSSRPVDFDAVGDYRRKITRKEARDIVTAAKLYDTNARQNGKRPLGRTAVEILALFTHLAAYSGRVEPSYDYIQEKVGCARASIIRALRALHAHGFLEWMRRYAPSGNKEGPKLRQTSNAYKIKLPDLAKKLLDAFFKPRQIIPDDIAQAAAERALQVEEMRAGLTLREQLALDFEDDATGQDMARRLANIFESIRAKEQARLANFGAEKLAF